ncbi:malectin domain-containing carbohydrate-binding protein [Georgenia sp. H159]|uniref:malectin domain-containing carbohydrate-binding protein n=1 Tax=Georgenia sp. H159 TaxID=3076115 RepID=UPI002D77C23C|nr:malectin domain-containing carbohydrate-binding protein [Georgenia sp. H159]
MSALTRSALSHRSERDRPGRRRRRRSVWTALATFMVVALLPQLPALGHAADLDLWVSGSADRSGSIGLSGAAIDGNAYIYLPTDPAIAKVEFWLDNPDMSGSPRQVEREGPYDFAGGSVTKANAFNTATVADGPHSIAARITATDGHVEVLEVNFTVGEPAAPPPDEEPPVEEPPGEEPPAEGATLRINAGGPAVTTGGVTWQADTYFSGGKSYSNSKVSAISGTTDDVLYLTERSATKNLGGFSYAIPAPADGEYTVRLHFAEIYFGATGGGAGGSGKRVFDVNIEGGAVEVDNYDIYAAVGAMAAEVKTFTTTVTDGSLDLAFTASVNQPKISAIEVVSPGSTPDPDPEPTPDPDPEPTPDPDPTDPPADGTTLRINAGGPAVTTGGVAWQADSYVVGGKSWSTSSSTAISGTTDDVLYRTERSATADLTGFSYAIPAPDAGTYTVRLHFAEIYFTANGKRIFDVNIEGGPVEVDDYDIHAAVGANAAVVRSFTPTVTDGTLDLTFTASVNQPKVSAIEVVFPDGSTPPPDEEEPPPPDEEEPPTSPQDPSLFSWDSKADSPIGRSEAQGTAVGTKVYAFGGFQTGTKTTARSDVYDTVTNSWSRLPDMPQQLTHSPAVADGKTIWLVGGYDGNHPGGSTRNVWKFDTETLTWSAGPPLPEARGAGAATIVGRTLHFFGGTSRVAGSTADPDEPDHWVLNLDGGTTWQARAPMPNPRNHLVGATLGGKVYAIGGQHNENENTGLQSDVHRYDPATNAWTKVASLPVARSHAAVVVRNGSIVVLGGTNPGNIASRYVTAYHPREDVWTNLPQLPGGRKTPVAAMVGDVLYLTTGSHAVTNWAGRFADRWESSPSMPVSIGEVAGGIIGKSMYMIGESNSSTVAFDVSTGSWKSGLAMRPYRGHHHAAEVVGDRLFLIGGLGGGSAGKVQIYNPATNAWTLGADMPFAAGSISTAVINGKIYAAGGIIGSTTTTRSAVYNPATNSWTEIAPMPQGRNHAASTTDGSKLYVAGGRGPGSGDANVVANGFDTLQVYDPATNTWRSSASSGSGLAPLPQARGGMGKAVWYDGEMYVIGGETQNGAGATANRVYNRVDIYNPATNSWRLGTPMPTARHGIFPLLVGNRIVVAGGGVTAGFSHSTVVETYNPR